MRHKLKKKTRKRLKRLARTMGRVGGAIAVEMVTEMIATFAERSSELTVRIERHRAERAAAPRPRSENGARERDHGLPRTADDHA
ncbi:hypothetical protein [Sandaracinus amylolyticus]|uniref:Uncharacterized protein n=1 Tax=Sandaracinus amylolyticus TaxID=927083 RepID=A0A0F6YGS1_9BACT|nr:hypothetical protein [Sandaracinus amylolyticus]AKF03995.1 hypothetical protein DB32_001144 [Sandaracinus amylolyticus]